VGQLSTSLSENDNMRTGVILLAEDNTAHQILIKRAFKGTGHKIFIVEDGEQCLKYLRSQEPYQNMPYPNILLLDLNLPCLDGHEVMKQINRNQHIQPLIVIVLTTSKVSHHIKEAYDLGAKAYISTVEK